MATSAIYHHRARIAALSRDREPDDLDLADARRALRAERLAEAITNAVSAAPPLTDEQVDRLGQLLRAGRTSEQGVA